MKYNKETICIIRTSIEELQGRVNAAKNAGISYQTLLNWLNPEHPNFRPELVEIIKEAELFAAEKGKDVAVAAIFAQMEKHWQAAAWWLERNFPDQYSQKNVHNVDAIIRGKTVPPLNIIVAE